MIATSLAVPVGFESTATNHQKDVTIAIANTTVRGLFDSIVQADPDYEWTIADRSLVNVYPRSRRERILDRVVPQFTVHGKTRSQALQELTETPTFTLLLRDLHAHLHTLVSGPPNGSEVGPKIDFDLRGASIRKILNSIVIASKGRGWTAVRYGDHLQYLSLSLG